MTRTKELFAIVAVAGMMTLLFRHGDAFGIPKTFLIPRVGLMTIPTTRNRNHRNLDGNRALEMQHQSIEEKHGGKNRGGGGGGDCRNFDPRMRSARHDPSIQPKGSARLIMPVDREQTKSLAVLAGATMCVVVGGRAIAGLVPRIVMKAVSISLFGLFWYRTLVSDDKNKEQNHTESQQHTISSEDPRGNHDKRLTMEISGIDLRANPPDMIISF